MNVISKLLAKLKREDEELGPMPRKLEVEIVGDPESLERAFGKKRAKPEDKQRKMSENKSA